MQFGYFPLVSISVGTVFWKYVVEKGKTSVCTPLDMVSAGKG